MLLHVGADAPMSLQGEAAGRTIVHIVLLLVIQNATVSRSVQSLPLSHLCFSLPWLYMPSATII